jgi:hypothetical protein
VKTVNNNLLRYGNLTKVSSEVKATGFVGAQPNRIRSERSSVAFLVQMLLCFVSCRISYVLCLSPFVCTQKTGRLMKSGEVLRFVVLSS